MSEPSRGAAGDAALFAHAARLSAEGKRFAVVTVVRTAGSTPRKPGAKMIVDAEGNAFGTIGGGRVEHELAEEAARAAIDGKPRLVTKHLTRDLAMCCGGEVDVFIDPSGRRETLVLVGAGHIHQALAPIGVSLGFDVVVADELEEMASEARFPPPVRHVHDFSPKSWPVKLDGDAYLVVATRDHAVDQRVLEELAALGASPAYLGVVGSRAKLARFKKRLDAKGIDAAFVASIRGPIGVKIGSETPAEIAVSIAGELVAVRRGVEVTTERAREPKPIAAETEVERS